MPIGYQMVFFVKVILFFVVETIITVLTVLGTKDVFYDKLQKAAVQVNPLTPGVHSKVNSYKNV